MSEFFKSLIVILILLSFIGCKDSKTKSNTSDTLANNSIEVQNQSTDSILWSNDSITVYYNMLGVEEWDEKKLRVYTQNKTLIELSNDDGGVISDPFFIEKEGEIFFIVFKTWSGSGNLSHKLFYHFNPQTIEVNEIKNQSVDSLIHQVKNEFEISEDLTTKKGDWYEEFDVNGDLPFQLVLYKNDNGRPTEKYLLLSGVYQIIKRDGLYYLNATNFKKSDLNKTN